MTSKAAVAFLAAISVTGLAACGSSGGGGKALSRADIVKKATAICKTADTESNKIKQPSNISDATQAATYFDAISKIAHKQHDEMSNLKPADAVKADFNAYLAEEAKAVKLVDDIAAAAKAKDAKKGAELMQQVSANTSFLAAAKKLGVPSCAS